MKVKLKNECLYGSQTLGYGLKSKNVFAETKTTATFPLKICSEPRILIVQIVKFELFPKLSSRYFKYGPSWYNDTPEVSREMYPQTLET